MTSTGLRASRPAYRLKSRKITTMPKRRKIRLTMEVVTKMNWSRLRFCRGLKKTRAVGG